VQKIDEGARVAICAREPARLETAHLEDGLNAAASEPELGSPSRGGMPSTTARRDGLGWRLNGRKTWTSLAPGLTYFVVSAGALLLPVFSPQIWARAHGFSMARPRSVGVTVTGKPAGPAASVKPDPAARP